ncbi:hypothetical protein ACQJBY_074032 [Aegilops geniculata]
MPQLDKLTYFSQFFWLCLLLFTFYILLFNNNNGILGISRILKLRNQLLSHRGGEIRSKDPKNLEDISRKGFSTGLSYMYSSLSEVSQWCKTVDYLGKKHNAHTCSTRARKHNIMKMNGILGGVVIFLLRIVTAFIGYVPPWGQMSFWGATVITSLASAIPVVGDTIVTWLWGGFSVDNATLNRFFSLHHLLALVLPFDLNVLPPGAEEFWQGQPPFPDHDSGESDDSSTDSSGSESSDSSTDSSGSESSDSSTDSSDLDTDYDELTSDSSTDSSGSESSDSSTDSSGSESSDMDCSEGTPPPEGNESRLIIFL